MIVACVSLFVALSGVGTAAVVVLKKNSVLSKHIKNEQVRSEDVKNLSLLSKDFAPGQLPAGPQGPQGALGPQGERGLAGADGQDGLNGQSFVWQGPWDSEASYSARDAVSHGGSSYIATADNRDTEPGSGLRGDVWQLMASKGDQGPPGADASANPEPWHAVGASGEPPFRMGNSEAQDAFCASEGASRWGNAAAETTPASAESAAFYRDRSGVVHLKGDVAGGYVNAGLGGGVFNLECPKIFTLPPGYRPANSQFFAADSFDWGTQKHVLGAIELRADGGVAARAGDPDRLSLDGITFRCAPSGTAGCP
jgi:hypothetical protein